VTGHLRNLERTTNIQGLPDRQIQTINPSVINSSPFESTYQAWLQVTNEDPSATATPTRLPNPDVSAGPHLGYVVQWIAFALLIWVGWWIIVRQADAEPTENQSSS
jgi:cytochrome oxidase assembly protein ShyY1